MSRNIIITVLSLFLLNVQVFGHEEDDQSFQENDVVQQMVRSANAILNDLSEEAHDQILYELTDEERMNWHFVPRDRNGLSFEQMKPSQRLLTHALINTALSHDGYWKANMIMFLEQVLHVLENNAPHRDPELYYLTIFGEPSTEDAWGWRIEGHHLSLNFTLKDGEFVAGTPLFMGTNPAVVPSGPHEGLEVLKDEIDLAHALLESFDDQQLEKVIIDEEAPSDIITGAKRTVDPVGPRGLSAAEMSAKQQSQLFRLIQEYAYNLRPEFAEQDIEKMMAEGFDQIYFAWAGDTELEEGHYYSITGPTFILEFDNVQNNANHIHTVWREFKGDWGMDVLKEHYETSPHHQDGQE